MYQQRRETMTLEQQAARLERVRQSLLAAAQDCADARDYCEDGDNEGKADAIFSLNTQLREAQSFLATIPQSA